MLAAIMDLDGAGNMDPNLPLTGSWYLLKELYRPDRTAHNDFE